MAYVDPLQSPQLTQRPHAAKDRWGPGERFGFIFTPLGDEAVIRFYSGTYNDPWKGGSLTYRVVPGHKTPTEMYHTDENDPDGRNPIDWKGSSPSLRNDGQIKFTYNANDDVTTVAFTQRDDEGHFMRIDVFYLKYRWQSGKEWQEYGGNLLVAT